MGQSTSQRAAPFRQWYTNLCELKSLLHSSTKYDIFTATASKATRTGIFKMLNLDVITIFSIVIVRKERSLENILAELVEEVKLKGKDIARCIIFCQTRKQCSRVYRMFQVAFGSNIFLNGSSNYEESLIHMFHAGSLPSVKTHAVSEMTKTDSCLRILICTIAFGMGIDCKGVYHSIQ